MELRISGDYVGTTLHILGMSLSLARASFDIVNLHRNCKKETGKAKKKQELHLILTVNRMHKKTETIYLLQFL